MVAMNSGVICCSSSVSAIVGRDAIDYHAGRGDRLGIGDDVLPDCAPRHRGRARLRPMPGIPRCLLYHIIPPARLRTTQYLFTLRVVRI
jgi:hypothetical protein